MRLQIPAAVPRREFNLPLLLILLGLFHGLLYIFIIPPWQHYDEPTQFEYAWLLANRKGVPAPGDYDQAMRREVAASMIENGFFRHLNFRPNLLSQEEPVWIGISQTGDRPFYYWLVSLPLRLVKGTDITFQLYLGRFVSLALYLISILAAYEIAVELLPPGHLLRWMLPLALVLMPGFTELMTAVNNDVGATAFFSLFLWAGIVLLRRGFSWPILGAAIGLALICIWTKNTVFVAALLLAIPLLFSILPGNHKRLAWIFLLVSGVVGIFLLFTWGDSALWYQIGIQEKPIRSFQANAPLGSYALELDLLPGVAPAQAFQLLPQDQVRELQGEKVTWGAWIWASDPGTYQTITLYDGINSYSPRVEVGTEPAFYAFSAQLDKKANRALILLLPNPTPSNRPVSVYYDGITLAKGERPKGQAPEYTDPDGRQGRWGGKPFENLIRNASAERAWFRVRPMAENFLTNLFPGTPAWMTTSLIDWPGSGWYYTSTAKALVQTFWGKFGWGQIPLIGRPTYKLLAGITLAGVIGALLLLIRRWRVLPKEILLLIATAASIVWGAAFFRGINSLNGITFIPSARYAFPAIIPTALLISAGWLELMRPLGLWKPAGRSVKIALILFFFLGLDILSVLSILKYYR